VAARIEGWEHERGGGESCGSGLTAMRGARGPLGRGRRVNLALAIVVCADEKTGAIMEGKGSARGDFEMCGSCGGSDTGGEGDNVARLWKGVLRVSGSGV
jgi:hypothetical protein